MDEKKEERDFFEKFITMSKEEAEARFRQGVQRGIARLYAHGIPAVFMDEMGLCQSFPDGHKEYLKQTDNPKAIEEYRSILDMRTDEMAALYKKASKKTF